jgi:3-phenylpropionate/cinnamic acid dioxygenase small subunit
MTAMLDPTIGSPLADPPFRYGGAVPPPIGKATLEYLLLTREIEEHLFYEADLLDQWKYRDWLELTTEDIRYWAPLRRTVRFGQWDREQSKELSELAWFDDNRAILEMRVRQLESGIHWSEEPLSRVCHVISGVRIVDAKPSVEAAQEVRVRSRFIVYRNHMDDEESLFIGKREDVLRRADDGGWRLARRSILIDQSVMLAQNLTILL